MQKELLAQIKKIKDWIKRNNVSDVILFGSVMRGKFAPNDIDLCIIINDNSEEKSIELVDSLGQLLDSSGPKFQINILTLSALVKGNTLAKTLFIEGYSIARGKSFCSNFGLESKSLFIYNLKNFTPSKRVQLHYLLNGRYGSRGILRDINAKLFGNGSIIVSIEKEDVLKEIFDKWKISYRIERALFS